MDEQFLRSFLCQGPDGTTKWMTLEQFNENLEIFNALHAYIHSQQQVRPATVSYTHFSITISPSTSDFLALYNTEQSL
jgi:hypothetical protein